jgi:predicted O-methyltransferase YrrM
MEIGRCLHALDNPYRLITPLGLHFRNGVDIDAGATAIWSLVSYYDFAKRLGIFSDDELRALASAGNDIQNKLTSTFRPEELKVLAHGAGELSDVKPTFLFLTVRKYVPAMVVETGVAQGMSSYFILKALQINGKGKLISIDLPNRDEKGFSYRDGTCDRVYTPVGLESGWLVPSGLHSFWDLRLGRSSDLLPTMQGNVDIFYHDSEHSYENMMFEFEWAYKHLKTGGILASDDVDWNDAFSDFARKHKDMRPLFDQRIFPSLIKTGSPKQKPV